MQRVKLEAGHDKAKLRAALDAAGLGKVAVAETAEGLHLDVPDDVDALRAERAARAHRRKSLAAAVRSAKTVAELRDAVADALDALL